MTYEEIAELIAFGETDTAEEEIEKLKVSRPDDVHTWILDATVCEARGNLDAEREAIKRGMEIDPRNYELFYMMSIMYAYRNVNQAYLCMEQAGFFCPDAADRAEIEKAKRALRTRHGFCVRNFSIVILSYNDKELMQQCVAAFRNDVPKEAYEMVVVDNHSEDGVAEWLRDQPDIRLIENGENVGFPIGCNIGYRACNAENDLLMINNDAVPAVNAIFWLRMGLYENVNVGATGAMSNRASTQFVAHAPETLEECMAFGAKYNVPKQFPYEDRCRLTGFAFFLKNEAHKAIRMDKDLLDTRFSPGYFEDDDLGMRLATSGFRQLLCHNAFIYHRGGSGFAKNNDAMTESREKFIDKWGFDIWAFEGVWYEMIEMIDADKRAPIRVLELYCGMGIDISRVKYEFPYAYVAGIDPDAMIAGFGRYMGDIHCGDVEAMDFPWAEGFFDYIIAADAIKNARDPKGLAEKLAKYLAPNGAILYEAPQDIGWRPQMERLMTESGFKTFDAHGEVVRARR